MLEILKTTIGYEWLERFARYDDHLNRPNRVNYVQIRLQGDSVDFEDEYISSETRRRKSCD